MKKIKKEYIIYVILIVLRNSIEIWSNDIGA